MQLFIVPQLEKKKNLIFLKNVPELLAQLRKVLRAKVWDTISVQTQEGEITRYTIQITNRTDKDLAGEIINEQLLLDSLDKGRGRRTNGGEDGGRTTEEGFAAGVTMLIAMPNKREKAELIVQKLSEIGVSEIAFRPAERSIIKQWNEKKVERLHKIAKEAVEQSWGVRVPRIVWCDDVRKACEGKGVVMFDATPLLKGGKERSDGGFEYHGEQGISQRTSPTPPSKGGKLGVIGPEGGLTAKDYQLFEPHEVVGLGETILRMETAAIIGWWKLQNL